MALKINLLVVISAIETVHGYLRRTLGIVFNPNRTEQIFCSENECEQIVPVGGSKSYLK